MKWPDACAAILGLAWVLGLPGRGEASWLPEFRASRARAAYDDGTRRLEEGRWREAEVLLQAALAADDDRVSPRALYNLGEVRFLAGQRALEEAHSIEEARREAEGGRQRLPEVLALADRALAGSAATPLVIARNRLRSVRRELRAAHDRVLRTDADLGAVEERWRRARADFEGVVELDPRRTRAGENAAVVATHLGQLGGRRREVGEFRDRLEADLREIERRLAALRERLPKDNPHDSRGEDDEPDESAPRRPEPSVSPESGGREQQLALTAEEALRLLDGLKVEATRQLPLGAPAPEPAGEGPRRDW